MKQFIRKALALAFVTVLSCAMLGCSAQTITNCIGDSVETDIVRFSLDRAEFAIALDNSGAATFGPGSNGLAKDSYYMPKAYDSDDDADNPYVAAKGHTLVSMTFSVENLDRDYVELEGLSSEPLFAIEYDGTVYPSGKSSEKGADGKAEFGVENENGKGWRDYKSSNILLHAGEASSYKCYVDIPVEVENLDSAFKVIVALPNSSGEIEHFEYGVDD